MPPTITNWALHIEIDTQHRVLNFPTFAAAAEAVATVVARLVPAGKMQDGADQIVLTSLSKITASRALELGGWAAASYTPVWRFAIIPEGGIGFTPKQIHDHVE